MNDLRITVRLLQYWQLIKKNEVIPKIEHFNSSVVGDIWQQCFLASVDPHADGRYKYEYMGPFIIETYGRDLTGTSLNNETTKRFPGKMAIKRMNEAASERRPIEDSGFFMNEGGKMIKYRACFLPFGNKHELTHVLVGLSYREF